ncbi:MAG TPA: RHS repeat-associated core domain-containing protein [Vicingaceae bacterium]|nr:RHS repeat-associated core domain-containing protein [Vicingaceae bacterium]
MNREYEDSFGLNLTETDYRQYDAALGRFNVMDALSEMAPNYTPYRYGFNNPVFWQDRTGLFESWASARAYQLSNGLSDAFIDYDWENSYWYINDGGSMISQVGDQILKTYEMDGEWIMDYSSAGGGGSSNSNSSASNESGWKTKLSADFTNAYSSSGFRHAVNWFNRNVDFGIYDFLYNNSAVTGYGSGAYGPWIPDAFGVSLSAGAWGSSVGFSLVLDNYNNFDWFVSYSGGAGYTGAGFSAGATFDLYNNKSDVNVFRGISGPTYDFNAGHVLMGGYSTPLDPKSRQIIDRGVDKYSLGLGSGVRAGEGRTYSSGEIYQMITNYFNSFNR